MEIIQCVVTYQGDITAKLTACGTSCPFRVSEVGDTEQLIELGRGAGLPKNTTPEQMIKMFEPLVLADAAKNAPIKSHRWVILEKSDD